MARTIFKIFSLWNVVIVGAAIIDPHKENFRQDAESTSSPTIVTTTNSTGLCTCGVFGSTIQDRIVGGSVAQPHQYPYQAGISEIFGKGSFCGGSMISRSNILTAAHCVKDVNADQIHVVLGDVNYTLDGDGENFFDVDEIIQHPKYNPDTSDYDFAIIKLKSPATISDEIGVVCLPPDASELFVGQEMTITGWGAEEFKGGSSSSLKAAHVIGLSNEECQEAYNSNTSSDGDNNGNGNGNDDDTNNRDYESDSESYSDDNNDNEEYDDDVEVKVVITDRMICAATPAFDADACQGDSGGPMTMTDN